MNPLLSTLLEGAWIGLAVAALLLLLFPWIDRTTRWRMVPIAISAALTFRYVIWRITETVPPIEQTVDFIAGIAFLSVEMSAIVGVIISFFMLSRTRNRTPDVEANLGWLLSRKRRPLVDVFICTYNEEQSILERTIIGAMSMSYSNYRVWVLDDGRRDWLRAYAEKVGANYLTRADNADAKAGNINNGLRHVSSLAEPPDFISILDADFVPAPMFLTRALTLFREKDVGVVQTPQHFVNPDPIQNNLAADDILPDEQRYFFDVLMPSKDAWGTAFCCGTSSVIRVDAIRKIGGMPTDSVTEDYLLTLRLQRNGYRTVYLNERLSFGLAPEGLKEYVTQRSRWCLGFMQIVRGPDGPFRLRNGLRLRDRISLIDSLSYWTAAHAFRIACFVVPVLYLLFDIRALTVDVVEGIAHFVPYYLAQLMVVSWLSERRVLPIVTDITQLLAAREVLKAAAIGLLFPKGHKFHVTAKGGDRSKRLVQWRMLSMFVMFLALTIAGLVLTFTLDPVRSWQNSAAIALYWSWYNIVVLIAAIAVCIERPRYRTNERFAASDLIWVNASDGWRRYAMRDVSISGIQVEGTPPATVGGTVSLRVGGNFFAGRIARVTPDSFAIAVEDSIPARRAMIHLVYSGRFGSTVESVSGRAVAQRIFARVLG